MVAQLLGIGITGKTLTDLEREILRETPPYAVVLFGRNIESVGQLKDLSAEIKALSAVPPVLMIDQEGGRVDRLRRLIPGFPSAEAFSEGDREEELAAWAGRLMGLALRYFDVECNLAPVVDIAREEPVKGLERRCFGSDPAKVTQLAGTFMRAMQKTGTAACLKHFPGIGMGSGDPHYGATVIRADRRTLIDFDLRPYFELGEEAAAVMIGHGTYPLIDEGKPASLSHVITTGLLRDEIGFTGLAISDDMEMHAVSDLGSYRDIAEHALMAGNDTILFCSQIEQIPQLVRDLEESVARDEKIAFRAKEALARAEAYRSHCQRLREDADTIDSFDEIEEEMTEFCDIWRATRHAPQVVPDDDRRKYGRSPGTGKSGREEWT
jgi:beta-N-acetylhexosaminidase